MTVKTNVDKSSSCANTLTPDNEEKEEQDEQARLEEPDDQPDKPKKDKRKTQQQEEAPSGDLKPDDEKPEAGHDTKTQNNKTSRSTVLQKSWVGHVIKDVPQDLLQQYKSDTPQDGIWAYASVEVQDSMGDVVRVSGIDWSEYHNNTTSMKILASHLRVLPDGSPPVIGRVETFNKTQTEDGKPALAFYMSWAKDDAGNYTDLSDKYRKLFKGGYLDSFSIGANSLERTALKGGGYDYEQTQLMEISAVTVPANSRAAVIREVSDTLSEDYNFVLQKSIEGTFERCLEKYITPVMERLDYLESTFVSKSSSPSPTSDHNTREVQKELQNLQTALNKVLTKI